MKLVWFWDVSLRSLCQFCWSNEDVDISNQQGARNNSQQNVEMKEILEPVPLPSRWFDRHNAMVATHTS